MRPPKIRCILQTTYPELEAEESRALHNQGQIAEPLISLFIYLLIYLFYLPFCHHAKSNTDFMLQFACFHLDFCVSSVHLSSLHRMLLCSLQELPALYFQINMPYSRLHLIYSHLLPLN